MDRCRYCEELNCEDCPLFDMKWGDEDEREVKTVSVLWERGSDI